MADLMNPRAIASVGLGVFLLVVSYGWTQVEIPCQAREAILIRDEQLRYELINFFHESSNVITCNDLLSLTSLSITSLQPYGTLKTLEGLQFAVNLEEISLPFPIAYPHPYAAHSVNDLTPLAGLSHLKSIYLKTSGIKDILPLSNLDNLESLSLMDNLITDLSPLTHLDSLTTLQLSGNPIEDIAPLKNLTRLETLWLGETALTLYYQHPKPKLDNSDIVILANFKGLKSLDLSGNSVTDVAPLQYLSGLEFLNLSRTGFQDLVLLENFSELQTLLLQEDNLKSIEPLAELTRLTLLRLDDNYIQDLTPLEQNVGLGTGDTVTLDGNCLNISLGSEASRIIAELESRGVAVEVGTQRPAHECLK